jgi:hypothetical protein
MSTSLATWPTGAVLRRCLEFSASATAKRLAST